MSYYFLVVFHVLIHSFLLQEIGVLWLITKCMEIWNLSTCWYYITVGCFLYGLYLTVPLCYYLLITFHVPTNPFSSFTGDITVGCFLIPFKFYCILVLFSDCISCTNPFSSFTGDRYLLAQNQMHGNLKHNYMLVLHYCRVFSKPFTF